MYFWYDGSQVHAKIYLDGELKVDASDSEVQSNVVNGVGKTIFGGRTGGSYNYHRIGKTLLIAKYIDPEPSVTVGSEEATPTCRAVILEPADLISYGDEQLRVLSVEYSYTQRGEEVTVTAGIPEPEIPFEMQRIPRAERWATL